MGITELLRRGVAPLAVASSLAFGSCTYHHPKTPGERIRDQLQQARVSDPEKEEILILYDRWPYGAPGPSERPDKPTLEVLARELQDAKNNGRYEQANSISSAIILAGICDGQVDYRIGGLTRRMESGALQMEQPLTRDDRTYRLAPASAIVYCLSSVNISQVIDVRNTYESIHRVKPPIFKFNPNKSQKLERIFE
ncbi:MAG: hypothetical protein AABW89_01770 [Nanoarchaeota archaeon]